MNCFPPGCIDGTETVVIMVVMMMMMTIVSVNTSQWQIFRALSVYCGSY